MEIRDPTIDFRLLKYLWGVPSDSIFCNNRKMFTINFKDIFSEDILNAKIKGIQAVDLLKKLTNEFDKLQYEFSKGNNMNLFYEYVSHQKFNKLLMRWNRKSNINEFLMGYSIKLLLNNL